MTTIPQKTVGDFSMPNYGLGTWAMGGRTERDVSNDDAADVRAIRQSIENGVTHIDTAEAYADGYCEELVGRAIKDVERSSLFLASKVAENHLQPEQLRASFEASCERLGTEYLDLYMLHRFSPDVPIDETMDAMCELVDDKLIRNIGVSNFTVDRMKAAQAVSRHKIVVNQVHYNLQIREAEQAGVLVYCQAQDVMLVAWGPVQKGALDLDAAPLVKVAREYDKTPTQVALSWLTSQPNVVVISKTRSMDHLSENLGGADWVMKSDDIEFLRTAMPGQRLVSDRVPLNY